MAYPYTESGYNMFDMLSMIQKSIRRGDYEHAGFAANQLRGAFRTTMWNRLFVISAEDCFGVLTKELVNLRTQDEKHKDDQNLSNAVALMCKSKKSRDACYFACNFVLSSRNPRELTPSESAVEQLYKNIASDHCGADNGDCEYDPFGFSQITMFDSAESAPINAVVPETDKMKAISGASLQIALSHIDMDMIGYEIDVLRREDRNFLWGVFLDYAKRCETPVYSEIKALMKADCIVNQRKKTLDKDEIFISKAAILLCYCCDHNIEAVQSSNIVCLTHCIDWAPIKVKPICACKLKENIIPDWVYDCHTLKGRQMGKTDWDMTTTEQKALYPLRPAYFDSASWIYTYEQDFENNAISLEGIRPIRKYAETHPANPVRFIPYE